MPQTSTLVEAMTILRTTERLLLNFRAELGRTEQRAGVDLDPAESVEQLTPYLLGAAHQLAVLRALLSQWPESPADETDASPLAEA